MHAIATVGQGYEALDAKEGLDATMLLPSYIGLPLFLGMQVFHKIVTRSPKVKSVDADLSRTPSDVRESEETLGG